MRPMWHLRWTNARCCRRIMIKWIIVGGDWEDFTIQSDQTCPNGRMMLLSIYISICWRLRIHYRLGVSIATWLVMSRRGVYDSLIVKVVMHSTRWHNIVLNRFSHLVGARPTFYWRVIESGARRTKILRVPVLPESHDSRLVRALYVPSDFFSLALLLPS